MKFSITLLLLCFSFFAFSQKWLNSVDLANSFWNLEQLQSDGQGNVYLKLETAGAVNYQNHYFASNSVFIVAFDEDGELITRIQLPIGLKYEQFVVGPDPNIVITGVFENTLLIDNQIINAENGYDLLILNYDLQGDLVWFKNFDAEPGFFVPRLGVGPGGNVFVAFSFDDALNFDSLVIDLILNENRSIALLKLNEDGELLWGKAIDGFGANKILVNNEGEPIILGTWPKNAVIVIGDETEFGVQSFDSEGNKTWRQAFHPNGNMECSGFTTDKQGSVYGCCSFTQSVEIPNDTLLQAIDFYDMMVYKINNNGELKWVSHVGGNSDEDEFGVAVDDNGNVYLTADYVKELIFGGVKYSYTGDLNWHVLSMLAQFDSLGNQKSILIDPDGFSGGPQAGVAVNGCDVLIAGNGKLIIDGKTKIKGDYLLSAVFPGLCDDVINNTQESHPAKQDLALAPNPTFGEMSLTLPNASSHFQVDLFSSDGKHLYDYGTHQTKRLTLDISKFPKGVYFLKTLEVETGLRFSNKIIKLGN